MSSTGVGDSIEPEGRMVIPAHMLHVVSLASMETLLSDTEVEQKSPSSESETSIDSPAPSELGCRDSDSGAASVERDGEFHPGSRLDAVSLKECFCDLTLFSQTDSDATQKASVNELPEKIPPSSLSQITDLYRKWKRLSWPMALCIILGLIILIWGHGHLLQLLQWLENLPLHESLLVFICLFSLVSLPFGFGYIILNVMAGYIYGIVNGQLIVMVSVAVGISNSFLLCRKWFRDYVKTMVTSNALQAMLRVVEGPNGFKVIVLTRFTPIPFGIQNVLFSVSLTNSNVQVDL